jgi:hypothetical protein
MVSCGSHAEPASCRRRTARCGALAGTAAAILEPHAGRDRAPPRGVHGGARAQRKRAGIDFVGTGATQLLRLGDVKLARDYEASGGWSGRRPPLVPLGDGYIRVITKEPVPPGFDHSAPMTLAELRDSAARAFGVELPIEDARWLSRFTDATRLAETFRAGRVLLAGDAAHVQLPAAAPASASASTTRSTSAGSSRASSAVARRPTCSTAITVNATLRAGACCAGRACRAR